jgi:hypothetical protein
VLLLLVVVVVVVGVVVMVVVAVLHASESVLGALGHVRNFFQLAQKPEGLGEDLCAVVGVGIGRAHDGVPELLGGQEPVVCRQGPRPDDVPQIGIQDLKEDIVGAGGVPPMGSSSSSIGIGIVVAAVLPL